MQRQARPQAAVPPATHAAQDEPKVEAIVDTMIVRALRDAQQAEDPALRQEARTWLWVCCPDLADELGLPDPQAAGLPDAGLPGEVSAYTQRQRAA